MPEESAAPVAAPPPAPAPQAPASGTPPGAIHVTEATVSDKGPPQAPPKPGSAQERMFDDLRRRAGAIREERKAVETKPEEAPEESPPEPGEPKPEARVESGKKGKVNPWKLIDEHKAARLKAEQEIAELRKQMVEPAKLKEMEEKLAEISKKNKEYEDEIRYANYEKHPEFIEKYQTPYENAWKRWMGELGELTVQDEASGTERPLSPGDLLELVKLPLPKAREAAEAKFGAFANDVMNARKEIRSLFDAKSDALDKVRKMGSERESELRKQAETAAAEIHKEVSSTWNKINEEVVNDAKTGAYFKPIEGDEEGNKRLAKGYEMADKAFHSPNPGDPSLSPQQRSEIIRLHAAIRHRAAAFGRVAWQNQVLQSRIDELTKELNGFKNAQPGAATPRQQKPANAPRSARDEVFSALRNIAR